MADEIDVGIRKSDNSRWVKFYVGEYENEAVGELFKMVGNPQVYKVNVEIEE